MGAGSRGHPRRGADRAPHDWEGDDGPGACRAAVTGERSENPEVDDMPSTEFIRDVGLVKWITRYSVRQFRKRVLSRGASVTLPTGLEYYAPPWDTSGTEAYVTDADMDWGSEALLSRVLREDGTFIDVGAHTGYYSLYMLPLVAWVYAFEPDEESHAVLREHEGRYDNLLCFREAVSNRSGVMDVQVKGRGFTFIKDTVIEPFSPIETASHQVRVVRLDDYLDDYNAAVTGIKIDIDGSDLDAIEGAVETITRFKPTILTELSSREFPRMFDLSRQFDYLAYAFAKPLDDPRRIAFTQLLERSAEDVRVKMIFLIPRDNRAVFDEQCANAVWPTADGRGAP